MKRLFCISLIALLVGCAQNPTTYNHAANKAYDSIDSLNRLKRAAYERESYEHETNYRNNKTVINNHYYNDNAVQPKQNTVILRQNVSKSTVVEPKKVEVITPKNTPIAPQKTAPVTPPKIEPQKVAPSKSSFFGSTSTPKTENKVAPNASKSSFFGSKPSNNAPKSYRRK